MKIYVVDAFTDRPFAGNPAGVCPLSAPADPQWMQLVAAEMNHSETAFPRRIDDPDADFELRWFTPSVEVSLCGHATLASAHVLYETSAAEGPIRFRTLRSGVLTVNRESNGTITMDFPACPAEKIEEPAGLAAALGATVLWTGRNVQNDLLALVGDARTVRELTADIGALSRIDARGVGVTAAGDGRHDFISRFYGSGVGIGEDPVTGSAHCMLAPFWAERLGRDELAGYQASPRGGEVRTVLKGTRVELSGGAVTVLAGDLLV